VNTVTIHREVSQYKQFANECRAMATTVPNPEHRKMLQDMAAAWDRVAKERTLERSPTAK
jgi:hypothetical protein